MKGMTKIPLFHLLHVAAQRADMLFANQRSPVTPRQYVVLAMLEGEGGTSQTDIVGTTGIDRSTMTDLVKRLVALGYVRRKRSRADARAYVIRLTDTGQKVLDASRRAAALTDEWLLAPVASRQRVRFLEELTRVAKGTSHSGN